MQNNPHTSRFQFLKGKRHIVKSIIERLESRFNVKIELSYPNDMGKINMCFIVHNKNEYNKSKGTKMKNS